MSRSPHVMNPSAMMRYEWNTLPWRELEKQVFKLQKRIFQASRCGDVATLHRLQHLVMTSRAAALLATRKVTQDNRGKRTAGIDGVKTLTPLERLQLATQLQGSPYQSKGTPTRRVWIPKPGTTDHRPLSIPTMEDRARQALAKLALEPEWEAKFESNSFGFRPGRSAHDAIRYIYHCITDAPRYVLDADIQKCFDRINHDALLEKLSTYPAMRRTIKGWLQAGVLDGTQLFPTEEGTPQGGVASPLLANIALHGLQTAIENAFPSKPRIHPYTGERMTGARRLQWQPKVVRFADDFVIIHQDSQAIQEAKGIAQTWLAQMGLELNEKKTAITHTLDRVEGNVGFDFLGFHIRHHAQGKTGLRHTAHGTLDFRAHITPSKVAKTAHIKALSEVVRSMRACSQEDLIARLNPLITGWANYHALGLSKELSKMDNVLYHQLKRWTRRRHPKWHWHQVARKYWHPKGNAQWVFCSPDGKVVLATHARRVIRQKPLRGNGSIYDGDWPYWTSRLGRHPLITPSRARLLKKQEGKCALCGLHFRAEDLLEYDHIIPTAQGGSRGLSNVQLLHAHCHDSKSAQDADRRANDNG